MPLASNTGERHFDVSGVLNRKDRLGQFIPGGFFYGSVRFCARYSLGAQA